MIDAVLTYHTHPLTCGVAKFNAQLARRLGVPCLPLTRWPDTRYPLVSIKPSEVNAAWFWNWSVRRPYVLFLHEWVDAVTPLVCGAESILAANGVIADHVRPHRADVVTAWCPSTIEGTPHRGTYRVLTFGMAHKLALPHFEALKTQLETEHPDYTVSLSTAVHEGSPWDEALQESTAAMRAIFGDRLRVLGFLADDALARELQECDAVAVYYDPAVRANNTTVWAALEAGKRVYTNTDDQSPPLDAAAHSWDRLVELVRAT